MNRFLIMTAAILVALTFTGVRAGYATATANAPDKVELLGHMSEKDKPKEEPAENPEAAESPKDPNFIPVTKLGNFSDEPTHIENTGRDKDTASFRHPEVP